METLKHLSKTLEMGITNPNKVPSAYYATPKRSPEPTSSLIVHTLGRVL